MLPPVVNSLLVAVKNTVFIKIDIATKKNYFKIFKTKFQRFFLKVLGNIVPEILSGVIK